ncbi:MAG: hypothetical protein J0L92_32190 [Deltaproteobacteria bacterium]|jgi:hypothetical protein|nr:hypothetical protein [Deltaproteobacteria bacterium]
MAFVVELDPGAEDNGLANMLATMMRQNVEDHPERVDIAKKMRGRMAIFAEDAEVSISIDFEGERVLFRDGIVGVPDLTIRGGFEQIGDLSRMEQVGAVPDPRGPVNRALFAAMREGKLRVHGLPRALPLLLGFGDVMHVA